MDKSELLLKLWDKYLGTLPFEEQELFIGFYLFRKGLDGVNKSLVDEIISIRHPRERSRLFRYYRAGKQLGLENDYDTSFDANRYAPEALPLTYLLSCRVVDVDTEKEIWFDWSTWNWISEDGYEDHVRAWRYPSHVRYNSPSEESMNPVDGPYVYNAGIKLPPIKDEENGVSIPVLHVGTGREVYYNHYTQRWFESNGEETNVKYWKFLDDEKK